MSSAGDEAVELGAAAGLLSDPWQEFALRAMLLEQAGGRWSCAAFGLVVPRQNGKGGVIEVRELAAVFLLPGELLITHTAHRFDTSLEAFQRMDALLEANADLSRRCIRVARSHGEEGFTFRVDGRIKRIRYRARTGGGGRGFTGDLLVLDEAMYVQDAMMRALRPALSARPNPQVLYAGSAVDQEEQEHGMAFAKVRERGVKGGDDRLGYMEWSAADSLDDVTDLDELADDEGAWRASNPALGIRISVDNVRDERLDMTTRGFLVERLNVGDWPATDVPEEGRITVEAWRRLIDPGSKVVDPVTLAYDVRPSRSAGAIAAAGMRRDELAHFEVVEHRRGTAWIVDRLVELSETHKPDAIVYDGASPAAALAGRLEKALEAAQLDVEIRRASSREFAQACGTMFDVVESGTARHLGQPELEQAVKGVERKPMGDDWAWSRKRSKVDISPLVACGLALWGAVGPGMTAKAKVSVDDFRIGVL